MWAIYNTLPFQKVPAQLVIEMAKTAVFWLNAFPVAGGVSQDLSPRTILTGQQVDYKRHCQFQFREYTQTHEEHNNSMNPRTVGALALQPVGNRQRSFYFLSIATGRVLNRLHATALPMPDDMIDKLDRMARQQKNNPGLVFADQNLNPDEYDDDEDDEDDETYHNDDSTSDDEEDILSYNEEENNDLGKEAEGNDPAPAPPIAELNDEQPEAEAEDMKGHTGATMSLGKGGIYSGSWKQRLVAHSSTESELIGVYDTLPQVLWTKQFLEEQGWRDSATIVYQDNTSSILLERNG